MAINKEDAVPVINLCRVVTSVENGIEYVCGVRMPCMRHWAPTQQRDTEADGLEAWEAEHPNGDPIFVR